MYKMKKSNSYIANVVAIALVLSTVVIVVMPVSAAAVSVTRDLPDAVYQGGKFNVSLTQSGFLLGAGKVTETLPEGFEYVLGSLRSDKCDYDEATNNLTIDFEGETTMTYVVKAGTAEQIENTVFSGTWRTVDSQLNKINGSVEGDTTLMLAEHTPAIEADTTSCVEFEMVKLTVTGVAGDEIKVESSPLSPHVIFKEGVDDTPIGENFHGNWFNDTIDVDGVRKYAVEFNDTGTYTIKVTVQGGPRDGDYDTVDITVSENAIIFDVPCTVIIGEKVKIKGTISAGDIVDILINDGDVTYFDDEPVDENNEFEVKWDTEGLQTGSYTIAVYIDCPYDSYDEIEAAGIDDDGKITIRLIYPLLTVNLSTNITQPRETIVINGTAMGTDHVDIITISPGGGDGVGLYEKSYLGVPGITNESIPVENNSFSKTINVSDCVTPTPTPGRGGGGGGDGGGGGVPCDSDGDGISDTDEMLAGTDPNDPCNPNSECAACLAMRGAYIIWVSVPGRDGEYGAWSTAENASELIKHIIDDYCSGNVSELRSKTREQILAILQDATIDRAGSDDVACVMELNVHNFSITVSPLVAVLYVGETKQFNATAYDQYAAEMPDVVFAWASSSETVGTVGATTGLFTAIAVGTTTITATNGTVSGTASVTVKRHYVSGRGGAAPRDSDGDGYSDIDEMLAGTDKDDPCDPNPDCAACLAIRPPTPSPTLTPTPKPTVTPIPTMLPTAAAAATPTPTPTLTSPCFEAVFTIAGLLAVAYLVLRRKRK